MTTYYVSSEIGSNNNAGTSATAPLATLQAAANLVQPGDTVEVMNGTYTGPRAAMWWTLPPAVLRAPPSPSRPLPDRRL